MKVYEVHYDNCESWPEDRFEYTECICATYEAAVKWLENKGLVEDKEKRLSCFEDDVEFNRVWKLPDDKRNKLDESV